MDQAAKGSKWVLFRNTTKKVVPIVKGEVIGHAKFANTGHIDQEWFDHMHRLPVAHRVDACWNG